MKPDYDTLLTNLLAAMVLIAVNKEKGDYGIFKN